MSRPLPRLAAPIRTASGGALLARGLLVWAVALAPLAAGCATSTVSNEAEQPASDDPAAPAADMPDEPAATEPAEPAPAPTMGEVGKPGAVAPVEGAADAAAKGSRADGESCDKADECASGVCDGEGCGPKQGKCAPKDRRCTRDLRPYCGCDGKTFQSSGSCPGQRYSAKGACQGDPAGPSIPKP